MDAEVALLLHKYVLPPEAERVVLCPLQMVVTPASVIWNEEGSTVTLIVSFFNWFPQGLFTVTTKFESKDTSGLIEEVVPPLLQL